MLTKNYNLMNRWAWVWVWVWVAVAVLWQDQRVSIAWAAGQATRFVVRQHKFTFTHPIQEFIQSHIPSIPWQFQFPLPSTKWMRLAGRLAAFVRHCLDLIRVLALIYNYCLSAGSVLAVPSATPPRPRHTIPPACPFLPYIFPYLHIFAIRRTLTNNQISFPQFLISCTLRLRHHHHHQGLEWEQGLCEDQSRILGKQQHILLF